MTTASSAPVLTLRELAFSYPGRHVFTHLSLEAAPGLTWVRGSNGSGKSTLLKLIAGALTPTLGELRVRGVDSRVRPLDYRREVFWCGPGPIAFDHLRPAEYFAFVQGLYPSFDAALLPPHVERLGLQPFLGKRLRELSTGTQRKVALAAAMAVGSTVVLLDEPLAALDQSSVQHVRDELARVAAVGTATGRVWIVVSHDDLGAAGVHAAHVDLDAA